MKAVVLAAGEGRRLRPLTTNISKGMLPIGNVPVIEYVIKALAGCDVRDISIIVGYQREKVMNHLGDGRGLGVRIDYIHQRFQLGTAHALFQAKDSIEGRFLVVPGDSLITPSGITDLLSIPEGEWGMLTATSSNSSKYGKVAVRGDHLQQIIEKHKISDDLISTGAPSVFSLALWEYSDPMGPSLINTGTYLFDEGIFEALERMGVGEAQKLISCLNDPSLGKRIRVKTTNSWLDAVYPFDLLDLNEYVLQSVAGSYEGSLDPGVVIKGPVDIGPKVRLRSNTVIEGPVKIGAGSSIGPCAYIGPNTSIGLNNSIGPMSVVKGSIIMDDVTIGSHSNVSNTIVSNGCSISDFFGVERGEYTIRLENQAFSKKLGACVGPDCQISHHVSLGPGVILGSGCKIGPMRNVRDNLPDMTRAV